MSDRIAQIRARLVRMKASEISGSNDDWSVQGPIDKGDVALVPADIDYLLAALDERTRERDESRSYGHAMSVARDVAMDDRDAWRARAEKAEAERDEAIAQRKAEHTTLRAVAHALGVCHCWDYGCEPGEREALISAATRTGQEEREIARLGAELAIAIEERDARPAITAEDAAGWDRDRNTRRNDDTWRQDRKAREQVEDALRAHAAKASGGGR